MINWLGSVSGWARASLGALAVIFANVAAADDFYRPRPGEAYDPATYCNWNRTGLPLEQREVCARLDRTTVHHDYQAKPGETLTVLLPRCDPNGGVSCSDDLFRRVWLRFVADNGETTEVDMNSIARHTDGGAEAVVYSYVPKTQFDPSALRRLQFDCAGHYMDTTDESSAVLDAPPLSVVGQIARIACSGHVPSYVARANDDVPKPSDYCQGFSAAACARMTATVSTGHKPGYCKPGFAIAPNGLSNEQLRICYVMVH